MSLVIEYFVTLFAVTLVCAVFEAVWDFFALRLGWSFTFRVGERIKTAWWWVVCMVAAAVFLFI